jgi:ATP-dependent DNA ligase
LIFRSNSSCTRRGFDGTERCPRISKAVATLRTASAIAVFEKLHSRAHDGEAVLNTFDLLELDGEDWRPLGLQRW